MNLNGIRWCFLVRWTVTSLTYAASAWCGYTSSADRQRTSKSLFGQAIALASVRMTYILPTIKQLAKDFDQTVFKSVLSVHCISSIGQIIKSLEVCVSVSQEVSESVIRNELNALQIAILHRSLPKLATKVESREVSLPVVFGGGGIRRSRPLNPNRKWN